ncbi:hypothetical protein CN596_11455 [Bacillus toyonensis]|uniref:DUF6602 domain-containing protein n=1 Tax=Bacillus toyonensis TaxID=155322 RepID=A0AB36SPC2_9BACI|nr:DUF6602 domain-containing protein [Bacillus toyonensis]PEJ86610.1 hypothetical protein CN891_15795 [Bacillus toyonensis]PEN55185.1 hypothetical protein CN596_11455 [Bacillus toyonensis]PGE73504.1 hypothetical protein COM58_21645 [Bacillus toyonensis]
MLKQSIYAAAKKMQIDFEQVTEHINHMGERGGSREEILLSYLRKYIPIKYEMNNGVIIDETGEQSRQQDIIIYDSFNSPVLLNMQSTKMVPIESVFSVIEVKSSLNKAEINKCVNNISSVKSLVKNSIGGINSPTAGFVFAFTSSTSLETLLDNLVEANTQVEKHKQISAVCVLDKGIILNVSKKGLNDIVLLPNEDSTPAVIKNTAENNLMLFYLLLMQYLNQSSVSVPNLLRYANAGELLNIEYIIPAKHVPLDASYKVGEGIIELETAYSMMKDSDLQKKIDEGKASSEDIMLFFSRQLKNIMNFTEKFTRVAQQNMGFMGKNYLISDIEKAIVTYKKLNSGEEVNEQELDFYNELNKDMYTQYQLYLQTQ